VAERGTWLGLLKGHPKFLFYWLSSVSGETGYAVYSIVVVWLAVQVSGGIAVAGLVLAIEYGIYSLSFVAGPFVDRARNLRTVLAIGYPLQMVVAFLMGLLLAERLLTVPLLLVLVSFLSVLWNFTYIAQNAVLPRLVAPGDIFPANGLVNVAAGTTQVLGFGAGAAFLVTVGPAGGAFLYAALNGLAALLALPVSIPQPAQRPGPIRTLFLEGWRFFLSKERRSLLHFALFSGVQSLFSTAPSLLIALFATHRFAEPTASYGILSTAFAVGYVGGSMLLAAANPRKRLLPWLVISTSGEGLLIAAAIAAVPSVPLSAGIWLGVGIADSIFFTAWIAYLQATVPGGMLGRAMTNFYVFRGATRAGGAALLGFLSLVLLPNSLGWLVAVGWVAIGLVGPVAFPAVRKISF
jgi:transmembrane secretion effector